MWRRVLSCELTLRFHTEPNYIPKRANRFRLKSLRHANTQLESAMLRRNLVGWMLPAAILAVAIAALVPSWMAQRIDTQKKPDLGDWNPTSIDVKIFGERVATLTNTVELISVLRNGRAVRQHRCSYSMRLSLFSANGATAEVAFRPGHTPAEYEFRCANGLFAVPRAAFMSAWAAAGGDTNQIPVK